MTEDIKCNTESPNHKLLRKSPPQSSSADLLLTPKVC